MEQEPEYSFSSEDSPEKNKESSPETVLYSKLDELLSQEDREFFESSNQILESLYEGFKEFQAKNDRKVDIYNPDMIRELDEYWQSDEAQEILENFLESAELTFGIIRSTIRKEKPTEAALEFFIREEIIKKLTEEDLIESPDEANVVRKVYLPEYASQGYKVKSYREKLEGLDNFEEEFNESEQERIIRRGNIMMELGKFVAGRSDEFSLGFDEDKVEELINSDLETDEITRQIKGYSVNFQIAIQEGKDKMIDDSATPKPTLPLLNNHLDRVLNNPEEFQRNESGGYGHLNHRLYMDEADLNKKRKRILSALSHEVGNLEALENYAEKIGVDI